MRKTVTALDLDAVRTGYSLDPTMIRPLVKEAQRHAGLRQIDDLRNEDDILWYNDEQHTRVCVVLLCNGMVCYVSRPGRRSHRAS
jgi:hypothetical protein